METKVTKIDALPKLEKKLRVAAYARVSSEKDAMLQSLSNQVSYYNNLIRSTEGWSFVGVYADEALSGTKDTRDEFQILIKDAVEGKIDLILVKSISRFARNTVTMLETVRKLKAIGVDVYFEEQNLHSLSGEGEMVLTFLASFAQEEARSVSENQKWKVRKTFESGVQWSATKSYGYRVINKKYVVVPEEAKIVKYIFDLYINGLGFQAISNKLQSENIKPFYAKSWNKTSVKNIISNINYTGDLLLQKGYSENFLTKKYVANKGAKDQFLVEDDHEAIISKEIFNKAMDLKRGRAKYFKTSRETQIRYELSGKIKCGICGKSFNHRTTKYSQKWICITYNEKGKSVCPSKCVPDAELKRITDKVGIDNIDWVEVFPNNELKIYLHDGTKVIEKWNDYSRKNSWTDEMKAKAREQAIKKSLVNYLKGGSING